MLPAEAIQVVERTAERVVILDPPFTSMGVWVLLLGVAALAAAAFLYTRALMTPLGWIALAVAIALGPFAGNLLTSQRRYILSKPEGLLTIERTSWGVTGTQATIQLRDIRKAVVRDQKVQSHNHRRADGRAGTGAGGWIEPPGVLRGGRRYKRMPRFLSAIAEQPRPEAEAKTSVTNDDHDI